MRFSSSHRPGAADLGVHQASDAEGDVRGAHVATATTREAQVVAEPDPFAQLDRVHLAAVRDHRQGIGEAGLQLVGASEVVVLVELIEEVRDADASGLTRRQCRIERLDGAGQGDAQLARGTFLGTCRRGGQGQHGEE